MIAYLFILLSFLPFIAPEPTVSGPACTTVSIPVSVSAKNAHFPPEFTTTSILSVIGALGLVLFDSLITDTYTIVGTYCEPEVVVESKRHTVQLLVHGATYTKTYWTGDGYNDRYSWVAAASKAGFPTLAIDRLGNGDSSHPDPILAVQYPIEVETIHQIIVKLRNGTLPAPLNSRFFTKVIYVGHSYGSIIGNALATNHPLDADSLILTGWSSSFITLIPSVLGTAVVLPASLSLPQYSSLPVGYLTINSKPGFRALFFAGANTYDASLFEYDFSNRGTNTAPEPPKTKSDSQQQVNAQNSKKGANTGAKVGFKQEGKGVKRGREDAPKENQNSKRHHSESQAPIKRETAAEREFNRLEQERQRLEREDQEARTEAAQAMRITQMEADLESMKRQVELDKIKRQVEAARAALDQHHNSQRPEQYGYDTNHSEADQRGRSQSTRPDSTNGARGGAFDQGRKKEEEEYQDVDYDLLDISDEPQYVQHLLDDSYRGRGGRGGQAHWQPRGGPWGRWGRGDRGYRGRGRGYRGRGGRGGGGN